jgi:hypothetical protein
MNFSEFQKYIANAGIDLNRYVYYNEDDGTVVPWDFDL